ncbi:MAG: sigma-54-dependent Fis family transcriptional regulator [Chrysiogenales bacterium]|nr:MAG: sigma-54-dependent Fis family transcriptional regulator [Chrysiogenales bacterium]
MLKKHEKCVQSKGTVSSSAVNELNIIRESIVQAVGLDQILGQSPAVQKISDEIIKIAACDVNVLITGESGTGKELAARAIHYLSRRSGKPFIPVNCGAIPENLFENELFGHVRGAFTDARYSQKGLVREAEYGTLFLDEISAISPFIQVKLLRLIQEKEFKPLGDAQSYHADIKIIAATNKDLEKLISLENFREDLYYRLNIVELKIPPLRERSEDIALLADHFVKKYCREYGKPRIRFTQKAMTSLNNYGWPGNIRELENVVQQLIVIAEEPLISREMLECCYLQAHAPKKEILAFKTAKKEMVDHFEIKYLRNLMKESLGNVASAAQRAGKSRTALWNLLKKHAVNPLHFSQPFLGSQKSETLEKTDALKIKGSSPQSKKPRHE